VVTLSDLAPGVALLVSVGIAALVVGLWARRWKYRMARNGPKILSSVSLGQRERLVEVLHEGEILLLGVTSQQIALIRARPECPAPGHRDPSERGEGTEAEKRNRRPASAISNFNDAALQIVPLDGGGGEWPSDSKQPRTLEANRELRNSAAGVVAGILCLSLMLWPDSGFAQNIPLFEAVPAKGGGTNYSVPVQTVILLTALSFVPAMLMLMTSFTRILIVLSLLRQAMGLVTTPPNAVLIGLALFITAAVMAPVADKVYGEAWQPYVAGRLNLEQAVDRGVEPVKAFMLRQTRADDLNLFVRLSGKTYEKPEDVPMTAVIPAFAISEIRTAFLIGFVIYLPFLAIDFAVASILTALGMVMVSPITFSLPLKLIVFVLADGWAMLVGGLVESFRMSG